MKPPSDLEVVHPGLEVVYHDHSTLEITQTSPESTEKVVCSRQLQGSNGKICVNETRSSSLVGLEGHEESYRKTRRRRPRVFFITFATLLVAITTGLGVGLGISLNHHGSPHHIDSQGHPLDIDLTPSHGILPSTGLGAISFSYLGNSARHVYWQTASGDIVESVWDSYSLEWGVRDVTQDVRGLNGSMDVMIGTPIAATVLFADHVFQINIEFIDSKGRLQELSRPYPDGKWYIGAEPQAFLSAGAKVASYWEHCALCTAFTDPTLHVLYINQLGALQHWSSSFASFPSPEIHIPGAIPLRATGIAMTEVSVGNSSELRAYYATSEYIQEIVFDKRTSTWVEGKQIPADIDSSNPPNLAAISHDSNSNGNSQFVLVVSNRPNVDDYIAGLNTFLLTPDDEVFEPFNPDVFGHVANFSAVAMDRDGRLYALMVDAEAKPPTVNLREFIDDDSGTGWMMAGIVSPS